ncbi:MAG: Fic family protein [Rhabdochlamydiaceae bacterium]|nr:Fic family protein [Rhabdochlamydiaceae bacterium]
MESITHMMPWNWQLPEWPRFNFDPALTVTQEKQFLLNAGSSAANLKSIEDREYKHLVVEILSIEGEKSARIEGELLESASLQSSIKKHFGLTSTTKRVPDKEAGMAELLCSVYESYDTPLSHEMLFKWHALLFKGAAHIEACGSYRTHPEPMQIVSNQSTANTVFFEAPPSAKVQEEMTQFITWFNTTSISLPILARAAIAHLYFENIHPFEDGNGRIGRVIAEKALSQGVGRPLLIALSERLEKRKKEYYAALEACNRSLDAQDWVIFFSEITLQAQEESIALIHFIIEKSKLLQRLEGQLNERQEKVLLRMLAEGLNGFKGGLSAENYITIAKTTRATATRDLNDLIKKRALIKTGQLRHTRYHLNLKSV